MWKENKADFGLIWIDMILMCWCLLFIQRRKKNDSQKCRQLEGTEVTVNHKLGNQISQFGSDYGFF